VCRSIMAAVQLVFNGTNLNFQKRMAMAILRCGQRKVWMDPTKKALIQEARTRESVRELIAKDIIQFKPSKRGKRTLLDSQKNFHNPILQRIRQKYAEKQNLTSTFPSQ